MSTPEVTGLSASGRSGESRAHRSRSETVAPGPVERYDGGLNTSPVSSSCTPSVTSRTHS